MSEQHECDCGQRYTSLEAAEACSRDCALDQSTCRRIMKRRPQQYHMEIAARAANLSTLKVMYPAD